MNLENVGSIEATIAGGFFGGVLIGYAIFGICGYSSSLPINGYEFIVVELRNIRV